MDVANPRYRIPPVSVDRLTLGPQPTSIVAVRLLGHDTGIASVSSLLVSAETTEATVRRLWARFDAKDCEAIAAMMADGACETDDASHGWIRRRAQIAEHFASLGARFSDSHTTVDDVRAEEANGAAIVTCVVTYAMTWDEKPWASKAPTSFVLLREGATWNIALLHTK